ncbi:MAG: NFACT RNA binding domain-containing protein [Candidatus Kapaibacterium sp.]
MIGHHLTLEHIARELSACLCGATLVRSWSQQKCVATMVFVRDSHEIPVVIDVSAQEASITTRQNAHRALRNSIDVFPELIGQTVGAVVKIQHDRVISFISENTVLHVELFSGGRGNIVLCRGSEIVDALRARSERIGTVFATLSGSAPEPLTQNDKSLLQDLSSCVLRLGRPYAEEVCHQAQVDSSVLVRDVSEAQRERIINSIDRFQIECHDHPQFLMLTRGDDVLMSLVPLHGWDIAERFESVIEAVRTTSFRRRSDRSLREERQRRLRTIDAQLNKLGRTLQAVLSDEAATGRADRYRSWADTLMAQPDVYRSGLDHLDLTNVVTGEDETIPLRSESTVLDNATALYAKARDAEQATKQREQRIPELRHRIDHLSEERNRIAAARTLADLPKQQIPMDNQQQTRTPTFREFHLDETHTLYVGRNAANNDELTMKFARQQDWWMHVRGASGSHAVLRGVSGPKIPKQILEAAAAITAYYSQARNASYVPVVYTQRKYVRKPKGANVGAVMLEREQTVMVRPSLPEGTISEE